MKLDFFLNLIVWYKLGFVVLTWTHGINLETCYREGLKVYIDLESWYRLGLMVWNWLHDIEKDSWYRLKIMV